MARARSFHTTTIFHVHGTVGVNRRRLPGYPIAYDGEHETRKALDSSFADDFARSAPGTCRPRGALRPRFGRLLRLRERLRVAPLLPRAAVGIGTRVEGLDVLGRFLSTSPSSYLRKEHVMAASWKSQTRDTAFL